MIDIIETYTSLRNTILKNRGVNITARSVTNDMFLLPTAVEVSKLKVLNAFVSKLQSFSAIVLMLDDSNFLSQVGESLNATVDEVTAIISDSLDKLASNYNKTRKVARAGTTIVSFYRYTAMSSSDLAKTIAAGTTVSSSTGAAYSTNTIALFSDAYFDSTYNAFMLDVAVTCTTAGTIGNAGVDAITTLPVTADWNGVTNKTAVVDGTNAETDVDFATRLQLEISGTNIGTYNGIQNLILQNTVVNDLIVIGAGDTGMQRDFGWGGKIDIYIAENVLEAASWEFIASGNEVDYILGERPIRTEGVASVTAGTLSHLVSDTTSVTAGSVDSTDYIVWSAPFPTAGTQITLSYFKNKVIKDVQDFIDGYDYNTGADVLIKQANSVFVDVAFTIVPLAGYYKTSLIPAITTILTDKINSLRMGEYLDQSDVIVWSTIEGVDSIVLPMTKFNKSINTGSVDRITTQPNEYIRLNSVTIK